MKKTGIILLLFVMILTTGCKDNSGSKGNTDSGMVGSETVSSEEAGAQSTEIATDSAVAPKTGREKKTPQDYLETNGKCHLHQGEFVAVPNREDVKACYSKKKRVAVASKNGFIYAKKPGWAKILVKSESTGEITSYKVKVLKKGYMYSTQSIYKGDKMLLKCGFSNLPGRIRWRSINKTVARVGARGYVQTFKTGKTTLIGRSRKGRTYYCKLRVRKKPKNIIYLTFDDGPSSNITPKILNILKRNHVKATFFELRPASYDYKITRRLIREGHTLALHGFSHTYEQIYRSKKIYHQNLDKLQRLFFKKFGVWCSISRFPGGSSNQVSSYNRGIMTKITKSIHNWGYVYFDWSVSSGDAGLAYTKKAVYKNVTKYLRKGQENVVLMHDSTPKTYTAAALNDIIKYGKKHGYVFRSIKPSTMEVHHNVWN